MKKCITCLYVLLSISCYSQNLDLELYYYEKADSLMARNELVKAIECFSDAIRNSNGNTDIKLVSYSCRANCKSILGDLRGCMSDCNIVISMEGIIPKYFHRTLIPDLIKKMKGTCYQLRGMCFLNAGDKDSACSDWSKSGELGNVQAYEYISKYCE